MSIKMTEEKKKKCKQCIGTLDFKTNGFADGKPCKVYECDICGAMYSETDKNGKKNEDVSAYFDFEEGETFKYNLKVPDDLDYIILSCGLIGYIITNMSM